MLILADLGHDPKHWPSEAATAANQLEGSGGAEPPRKGFLVSRHRWLGTTLTRICHMHGKVAPDLQHNPTSEATRQNLEAPEDLCANDAVRVRSRAV